MEYVIVSVLAFALGILSTLICVNVRSIRKMDQDQDKDKGNR